MVRSCDGRAAAQINTTRNLIYVAVGICVSRLVVVWTLNIMSTVSSILASHVSKHTGLLGVPLLSKFPLA